MNNPLDEFGAKVRSEREVRGLTQKTLAEKLGMSHRTVMQAEICRSNPKFETVVLIARELNISNLRKKLKVSESVADHIKSIRGVGYKFEA